MSGGGNGKIMSPLEGKGFGSLGLFLGVDQSSRERKMSWVISVRENVARADQTTRTLGREQKSRVTTQ